MDAKTPKELAEEVLKLNNDDLKIFLRLVSEKIKNSDVNSPEFVAACYIGIASNWINEID